MVISVAIIGSGPAGFYAADALLNTGLDIEIDILELLPTPFGLVRGGVAPDHQPTKGVARKFEKIGNDIRLQFFGNVNVGKDITIDDLRGMYDAVILAVGAPSDRKLTIPGADKDGVFGSAAFVGWYNGHPDFADIDPNLKINAAVVIGNGNVALDVARVLVRSPAGRARTDIPGYARTPLDASPITDVYILGRRGPAQAKFTNVELRELLDLTECVPIVDPADLAQAIPADLEGRDRRLAEKNIETFHAFAEMDPALASKRLHFRFFASPLEILGDTHVQGVRVERTRLEDGRAVGTGVVDDIPCGLIVSAIGYRADPIPGLPFDDKRGVIPNEQGRIDKGIYAVGWIMRGPEGVISSSRPDATDVAEHIMRDFQGGGSKPGRSALDKALAERGVRVVSFADWKRIDAAEAGRASAPAPRQKFTDLDDMIRHLDEDK